MREARVKRILTNRKNSVTKGRKLDRRYSLEQTSEALLYLETGKARGKLVVTIE